MQKHHGMYPFADPAIKNYSETLPSLVRVTERIIRLLHVLRKVYAGDGEDFPLDEDNNRDDVLQL